MPIEINKRGSKVITPPGHSREMEVLEDITRIVEDVAPNLVTPGVQITQDEEPLVIPKHIPPEELPESPEH